MGMAGFTGRFTGRNQSLVTGLLPKAKNHKIAELA